MGTDHSPSILLHSSRLCPKPVEGTPPVERRARAEPGTAEEGVKGQTTVAMKSELTSVCASGGLLKARRPDWQSSCRAPALTYAADGNLGIDKNDWA